MIRRVYEQASNSDADAVYVATDDGRIADEVKRFGGRVVMTSPDHSTGTDRIFEATSLIGIADDDIVVNVQGDEPLIPPAVINKVAEMIDLDVQMSTLCELIVAPKEVLRTHKARAIYSNTGVTSTR